MSNKNIFLYKGGKLEQFGSEKLPESQVKTNIDWVIYGTRPDWVNRQPQYYDYLAKTSPKNTAILKTKDRQVYGKGLDFIDTAFLDKEAKIKLKVFIRGTKQSRVTQRIIADRNKFNGFAVEVIFDKKRENIMPHHVPFKDVRVSKKVYNKENELEPTQYYYTSDWSLGQAKIKAAPDFTVFEEFDWDADNYDVNKRYLIYYKGEEYVQDYYPLPDYLGGVPYVSADTEVANFVENNVKNGFTGGYLINFYNGDPDEDAKREITNKIDEVLHGTDNAGKSIKSFNENKDSGVEITPLGANGQDDRYLNLNNQIRDEIFTAHTTSPLVVGMKGDNGFNNNADEKRVATEDFIETFVVPTQEIFNELFNNILLFNELQGEVYLQRLDPLKPQFTENLIKEIATPDELRVMIGLEPSAIKSNEVADSLAMISPLVATKVLEAMSIEEIRAIVGLTTSEDGVMRKTQTTIKEFSKEDDAKICEAFEQCGTNDDDLEVIDSREIFATDLDDAKRQGEAFRQQFASTLDWAILSLLNGDNTLTPKALAELTGETTQTVTDSLASLENEGLMSGGIPTDKGMQEIAKQESFVVYKYVQRADAPALLPGGTSRPFCLRMLGLSKTRSWTIEDINTISSVEGYDVFTRRGGWYHNPDTNVNTAYCRHIWQQRIVKRK